MVRGDRLWLRNMVRGAGYGADHLRSDISMPNTKATKELKRTELKENNQEQKIKHVAKPKRSKTDKVYYQLKKNNSL